MIMSRTPFRISLFGGGTDYPAWYREEGGAVLSTSINKYCYISCRWLPPFFDYRSRISWSKIELVQDNSEIEHPAARVALNFLGIDQGIDLHHQGDLPARTGLGSSSAFTVGLLHALYGLKGIMPQKMQLALDAIHVEQGLLGENVGSQDQVISAFGGFNRIDFLTDGAIRVSPILMEPELLARLQDHFLLVFTGISRTASEIAGEQIRATSKKKEELRLIRQTVERAIEILQGRGDLEDLGRLLDESWRIKRSLTRMISTPLVDSIYEVACRAGALGGKLLGAGGGGFLLLFVRPEQKQKIGQALKNLLHVPFRFENSGSQIIFYNPDSLYQAPKEVADRKADGETRQTRDAMILKV